MPIPWLWFAAAINLAHAQGDLRQAPAFRLGDVAKPIEYAATLAIDPREARFSGEVRITLRVNRATPILWLNATNLTVESAAFQQGNSTLAVTVVPGGEDFVGFQSKGADFVPGVVLATIKYQGTLEPVSTRGLFRQQEGGEGYVVALAIGPFEVVDGGTAGAKRTKLRYFAPKGRGAETRYAKEATPRLLELLEDYFGMPYPFDKLDSVSIPQTVGFGAMENVGMITYGSRILLAPRREETLAFQRRYVGYAAHELAHMWFGNLVTLAWWDDLWLNEAFASWMGNKTATAFRPEWDNGASLGWARRNALELDRLASARRVR